MFHIFDHPLMFDNRSVNSDIKANNIQLDLPEALGTFVRRGTTYAPS